MIKKICILIVVVICVMGGSVLKTIAKDNLQVSLLPPIEPLSQAIDLVSALSANVDAFKDFSTRSNNVNITAASVQRINSTHTTFYIDGLKMEGDIVLGTVVLKIHRTQKGTNPENLFYTYTTEIFEH